jgi:signal transduction histidine kinase
MLDEFIERRREDIVAELGRRLSADEPTKPTNALLSNVPQFVDELQHALQNLDEPIPAASTKTEEIAARQGEQRYELGVSPAVVARSFGLLCEIVSELAAEDDLALPAREVQVMNECIDIGIATALDEYWKRSSAGHERDTSRRLGFLAHELRNHLATATFAFDAFRQGTVAIHGRTAAMLDRSLKSMAGLISHALAEARLAGHEPVLERTHLNQLVHDIETAAPRERHVRLSVDVTQDTEVVVDQVLFASALGNLVQNAIKFTRRGGAVVIRSRVNGDDVVVEVEDECGGLSADPAELVQPFVQRNDDRSGAGLGLAITKEAVEKFGGTLHARNLPGKGCVFAITIPRRP